MATSPYFNNYNAKYNEQRLVEDLITESIQIMGFNAFYLPNNNDAARDLVYGEDPTKKFQSAFQVEMYLSSSNDYMGEREMFSKFGLEIRNQVTVILSKRAFSQRIPQNTFTRPREGDLIYIPFLNGTGELYEIKFTNQNKDFHMLGRKVPYYYELELEKFKYSQEVISTGIADIDIVMNDSAYSLQLNVAPIYNIYSTVEIPNNPSFDIPAGSDYMYVTQQSWEQSGITSTNFYTLKPGVIISDPKFPANTTITTILGPQLALGFEVYGLFTSANISTTLVSNTSVTLAIPQVVKDFTIKEIVYQSLDGTYANAITTATVQGFNQLANTLTVTTISGEFNDTLPVYGQLSGAFYSLVTYDPLSPATPKESYSNDVISDQSESIVNQTEINPIGGL
jgi:hypothetical protein